MFGLLRGRSAPFTLAEAVADVKIVAATEDTALGRRREGEEGIKEKLDSVLRSLLSEGALIPVATSGAQGSSYEVRQVTRGSTVRHCPVYSAVFVRGTAFASSDSWLHRKKTAKQT